MKPKKRLYIPIWWPDWATGRFTTWLTGWRGWLPTKGNVLFTILVIGILLFTQQAGAIILGTPAATQSISAQLTSTIPYQGRLADSTGNPMSGTYAMGFTLYKESEGGDPLWTETRLGGSSVQVDDGLFNVMLGSVVPLPQSVITENDTLYLGITIGTNDEMIPRVQLGSVPYAVQALTVPDGSVTSRKVKLQHGRAEADFATSTVVLPTSFMELDGTRTEITLDVPQTLVVFGVFDFVTANGATASGKLNVNGEQSLNSAVLNGVRGTVGQVWMVELEAGTHTLFLMGRRASGHGSVSVYVRHTTMTWFSFAR